jgi:hypothetical protein
MKRWVRFLLGVVALLIAAVALGWVMLFVNQPLLASCFIRHGHPDEAMDRATARHACTATHEVAMTETRTRETLIKTYVYLVEVEDTRCMEFMDTFQKELLWDMALKAGDVTGYSGSFSQDDGDFTFRYRWGKCTLGIAEGKGSTQSNGTIRIELTLSERKK